MQTPKVLLCSLPVGNPGEPVFQKATDYRQPRLGVQAIRDHLIYAGYPGASISFLDIEMLNPSDDELTQFFLDNQADIVGLGAVLSHSYQQVKRISSIARKVLPNAWIVIGGHLTASAEVILNKTAADVCVVGDGEEPFFEFVQYAQVAGLKKDIEKLSMIQGLCFLDDNGQTIFMGYGKKPRNEVIPMPDYEFFKSGLLNKPEMVDRYFQPVDKKGNWFFLDPRSKEPGRRPNTAQIPTTKGCTARCTFCQRSTKGYRLANLSDLETHLIEIIDKYDVGFISVLDENFGSRRDHARAFADLMKKYNLLWNASGVRCTNVNREDVEYFKQSGCCSLKFGVESGSQAILDSMEKNFTVEDVEKALAACWDNEMYSPLALMVGMPGERDRTIVETGQWIGKMAYKLGIEPDQMDYELFYALPFPGTPLYEHCIQVGLLSQDIDAEEQYLIAMAGSSTTKWSYLNVNGASPINVLAWDYLVRWQATKTYQLMLKEKPQVGSEFSQNWASGQESKGKDTLARKWNKSGGIFTRYGIVRMCSNLYTSYPIQMLPRWLAFPAIKLSFYIAIAAYHWVGLLTGRRSTVFMMYKDRPKSAPYIPPSSSEKRLKRSLRSQVSKRRQATDDSNQIARNQLLKGAAG